jgi:hypothetical protein
MAHYRNKRLHYKTLEFCKRHILIGNECRGVSYASAQKGADVDVLELALRPEVSPTGCINLLWREKKSFCDSEVKSQVTFSVTAINSVDYVVLLLYPVNPSIPSCIRPR